MSDAIITALKKLDVGNDNHWTADGLPRLDTVKMLASDQSLTRDAVDAASPGFNRANAATYGAPASTPQGGAPDAASPTQAGGEGAGDAQGSGPTAAEPPAEAEPEEVGGEQPTSEAAAQALAEELEDAQDDVDYLMQQKDRLEVALKTAQEKRDKLQVQVDKLTPKNNTQLTIQQYLASENAKNAARGQRTRTLLESGVNLKDIAKALAPSAIDAAMARKTDRGTKRPGR